MDDQLDRSAAARRRPRAPRGPLAEYALVHMTSAAGDAAVAVALADSIFFSLPIGEAAPRVALYLALTMAPLAVAGPLLVPLLDRGGFRRAMSFAAGAGRAAAAFYAAPRISSLLLFPAVFAVLVLSRIHAITKHGLTVAYAPRDRPLVAANSRLALWAVAGAVLGGPAALGAIRIGGARAALYVASAVYAVSALLSTRLHQPGTPAAGGGVKRRSRVHELGVAAAGVAALRAAHGFLLFAVAFALRRSGDPAWWLGAFVVSGLTGGLLGNLLVTRLTGATREQIVVVGSVLVAGAAALVALRVFSLPVLAAYGALAGMATESARLAFQSLMQRLAPEGAHGRVFVRYEVVFQLAWVAGALAAVLVQVTYRRGLLLLACFYLALGATAAVRRKRPARRVPAD